MARSPYIEAYRHQVAVGFTDRQYELLVEHCKSAACHCHRPSAMPTLRSTPCPMKTKNDTSAEVWRQKRTYHVNPERSILSPLL